jgi:hypothetical protein
MLLFVKDSKPTGEICESGPQRFIGFTEKITGKAFF